MDKQKLNNLFLLLVNKFSIALSICISIIFLFELYVPYNTVIFSFFITFISLIVISHYHLKKNNRIITVLYEKISHWLFFLGISLYFIVIILSFFELTIGTFIKNIIDYLPLIILVSGYIYINSTTNKVSLVSLEDETKSYRNFELSKHIILLGLICVLGFILRIWDLEYTQASDLFNLSAAKSFYDNGTFFYERNLQLTFLISTMFSIFEPTLFYARLPLAFFGVFSIILMYFFGSYISKSVAIVSSFLIAISPNAIEESTLIREYSENLMLSLVAYLVIFDAVKNFKNYKKYIISVGFLCLFIYTYSNIVNNYTIQILILIVGFASIPALIICRYNQLRKFNLEIYSLVSFFAVSVLLFFIFMHNFFAGFYSIGLETYWVKSFFSPSVAYPMQWFSFKPLETYFIFSLFIAPVFFVKNVYIKISSFTFFIVVLLFTLKFENTLTYVPTRYLYVLLPFYTLIFASSIVFIAKYLAINTYNKIIVYSLIVFIFINPSAIIHSAKHDLVRSWPTNDLRQPTSTGTREDVDELIEILKQKGELDNNHPIVLTDFNPSWLILEDNMTVDKVRYFSDNGNYKYEISSRLFLENAYWNVYELTDQINLNNEGLYITRSSQNFLNTHNYEKVEFKLITEYKGFDVYLWKK